MPLSPYQQVQQVRDHYNTVGLAFDQTRRKPLWTEILPFLDHVKTGMRVLDVGCGNGRLLTELGHKKIIYKGLDFSKILIDQAKKRFPNRTFILRDITIEDSWNNLGKFEAAFCLGVLHHIPDRKRHHLVLQQMYNHLAPGGIAVFSIWNLWQSRFLLDHVKQIPRKIQYGNFDYLWVPYKVSNGQKVTRQVLRFHKAFLPGEFIKLVKQVGFSVDTFYYATNNEDKLSILKGRNFCLLARKTV